MRVPLMAGNWKMFKTPAETTVFCERFLPLVASANHCEILLCPPFVSIAAAVAATQGSTVGVGAQNLHWQKEGAFTGEVSAPMIKAAGCRSVIIGHSERRQYFGETDTTVFKKTTAAIEAGLQPIVCVGELLEERESNRTNDVLARQVKDGLSGLRPDEFAKVVIAYEPVWAIGTGKTATPDMAADAHRFIREQVRLAFGEDAAAAVRILYGGSVKPDNVKGLMAQPEIDGALVGGASLKPEDFSLIVNF
ncbi:MAG: triose-phosphate isomerase [Bryobacterales bacterium]|nr:triose-phosphate isomerase [Bryobacterales bacterium]